MEGGGGAERLAAYLQQLGFDENAAALAAHTHPLDVNRATQFAADLQEQGYTSNAASASTPTFGSSPQGSSASAVASSSVGSTPSLSVPPAAANTEASTAPQMESLVTMGFTEAQAGEALSRSGGDLQQAAEWLAGKAAPATTRPVRLSSNSSERRYRGSTSSSAASAPRPRRARRQRHVSTPSSFSDSDSAGDLDKAPPRRPESEKALTTEEQNQVHRKLLAHKAVWTQDHATLARFCQHEPKGSLVAREDHHGNTPLHLAFKLGHHDTLNFLLTRGADPRGLGSRGWSLLQEACVRRNKAVALDVYMHTLLLRQKEWDMRLPDLSRSLKRIPDFSLEIKWELEHALVPRALSRMAPSDSFKVWKKGEKLRVDSSVGKGSTESFLFTDGSLYLLDHETRTYVDALAAFRQPSFHSMKKEVKRMMSSDIRRSDLLSDNLRFTPQQTWLGYDKREMVSGYPCRVMDMKGLEFCAVKLKRNGASGRTTRSSRSCFTVVQPQVPRRETKYSTKSHELPAYDDYFDERAMHSGDVKASSPHKLSVAQLRKMAEDRGIEALRKEVQAALWLTDDFPLDVKHLTSIFSIMAPASANIKKLNDILALKLPQGFPVKLTIPVFAGVAAAVTFENFERVPCDDKKLRIPAHYEDDA